jgi:type I restriction enzyme S subunit
VLVQLPSPRNQAAIAQFLTALDAKIELNHRINAELEGMAKLLYDYWFVQFDFPMTAAQAAALGKPHLTGHPYRASGGKMIHNETLKREIPERWGAKMLSKFANITMGQSPPGHSYNQEGSGLVFFQGSTDFGWRYPQVREFTTAPSRLAKRGDILLSVRAPVGTLNIADQDCCIGRGLAALNAKSGHDSFLFEVMLYFKGIFDRRNTSGTTFGSITKDDLHSLEFACPPAGSPLLDAFEETMKPAHKAIFINHQQNQELSQLRDWLLPMLMNGQVTVE